MNIFYVKTEKIRWRLKSRPTLQKCFKFKAFILKTHTDRPQTSHGAAARWLPTTDLQQRGFAVLFENAFRGKSSGTLVPR